MPEEANSATPVLPCPNCAENILAEGFYNYCSETTSLREDNYTQIIGDRLYLDHNESGHETVDHECDMEARCGSCDAELPWALYQIRGLDCEKLSDVPSMIAGLLAEPVASLPPTSAPELPTQEQRV